MSQQLFVRHVHLWWTLSKRQIQNNIDVDNIISRYSSLYENEVSNTFACSLSLTVASKCCARVGQHLDIIVLIHSTLSKSGYNAHDGKISAKGMPDKSDFDRFPLTLSASFISLKADSKASYTIYNNDNIDQKILLMVHNNIMQSSW